MHPKVVNLTCPCCERDTLLGREVEREERISPRFVPYMVFMQTCACEESGGITDIFIATDENGDREILYEYFATSEDSSNPLYDEFYGRF